MTDLMLRTVLLGVEAQQRRQYDGQALRNTSGRRQFVFLSPLHFCGGRKNTNIVEAVLIVIHTFDLCEPDTRDSMSVPDILAPRCMYHEALENSES